MSQITQGAVRDVFDTRLASFGAAGGDVNGEGNGYTPQAGVPYLSSKLLAYVRVPLGIGPNSPHSCSGVYQVNVMRPAIGGLTMGSSIAGRLVRLFARGTPLTLAGGQVVVIESATEQPVISAGDWLNIPVSIAWYVSE